MALRNIKIHILSSMIILSGAQSAFGKNALDYSRLPKETQLELEKRYPQVKGEKITLELVDEIIRFLQLKPKFESIQVFKDESGKPYRLEFKRTKMIAKVHMAGLENMSRSDAEGITGLKAGSVFDQQAILDAGEKLRQAYQERGFLNASIDVELPPADEDNVFVNFRVTENKITKISKMNFSSPNEELNQKISRELRGFVLDPYTEPTLTQIQKMAQEYFKKNRYTRAELMPPKIELNNDESEASLSYTIEKTDRYSFEFIGVRFFAIREIENALELDNFYSGNPAIGAELAQKIRSYYLAKGYARIDVKADESDGRTPHTRKVTFQIDEGPKIKIQKIVIAGKISKNSDYYINFIEDHSSKLIGDGYYNKEDFDTGVKNLVLELQNEGFLHAKVISTRSQYNKEKDEVILTINLDEGPLTEIETVQFVGNKEITKEQLLKISNLQTGALKLGQIEEAVNRIKDYYHEKGYIEMILLNEKSDLVTYDETNTKATLQFKIFEGPQVKVATLILEGNDFTKDYVIHNELDFKVGELLTLNKIDESVTRLQRTGFFGSVSIKTLEEKTNVANRTVLVKVTERDPGLFTLGFGATNERTLTLRGYTGIAYRNIQGTGRGVSLRLEGHYNVTDIKYLERKIVLGYLEPYLFDTRIRGRLNIARSMAVTDYDLRQVSEVNSTTYSLERDLSRHILGVWDVWSLATIRDFSIDSQSKIPTVIQEIATTSPTLDIDFRDNPFNPTRGSLTKWTTEYSSPSIGSTTSPDYSIEYIRSTLNITLYSPVAEIANQPVVWATQLRGGYLKNLSDKLNGGVPWDKKGFTLGGQSTIRGYEAGTQEVFPNRQDLGLSSTDRTYTLMTESSMYLIKSELRFPIWGGLGGAVFYDGGSVQIKGLDFPDSYRDSAGFGIRYNTPMGPFSMDLAWKLDARPSEEPWRFHLSIGAF